MNGVVKIQPFVVRNEIGSLVKFYSSSEFQDNGIHIECVEEANIFSKTGVLRGLHYQKSVIQSKLIRCIKGRIVVAVADIEKDSKTYSKWELFDISDGTAIYVPGEYAIGTLSLEDSFFHITYGERFVSELSSGIVWNDPTLAINWPLNLIDNGPILSNKDLNLPLL